MTAYQEADLQAKYIGAWNDDNFALFNYPPKWKEKFTVANDTTRLVLDFKEGVPAAIDRVVEAATTALLIHADRLRDDLGCRYLVAAPRSQAGVSNVGCEAIAAAVAARFPSFVHFRGALERTTTLAPSHGGASHSVADHVASMRYVGPRVAAAPANLDCAECGKHFRTPSGYRWHLEHSGHVAAAEAMDGFVLIDDVFTRGRTQEACREVLEAATGVPRVAGFFVGKTNGW